MKKFNFKTPGTWTWAELNAWAMGASEGDLRIALREEEKQKPPRLSYLMRIQARINVLAAASARGKILGKNGP